MRRSAAAQAADAADAVLAWLDTQGDASRPVLADGPADGSGTTAAARAPAPGQCAEMPGEADRAWPGTCPAHTDWLYHRLTIAGPLGDLDRFRAAASGSGTIPWQLDLERLEEDCFHRLVATPARALGAAGARILAGQLRDAVGRRHAAALRAVGRSTACPFDLHALLPVPDVVLERGPDDPAALSWLADRWGTTQALRHVTGHISPRDAGAREIAREADGAPVPASVELCFWSADWTPWQAFRQLRLAWPELRFDVRPCYDP